MATRFVAIVQARMGSSRLPGKVMMRLGGAAVLEHVVWRVLDSGAFDDVVVATTTSPADDVVAEQAALYGARVFRGSEADVLGRYAAAAADADADVIARVTADCPLIDPGCLASMVVLFRRESQVDVPAAMVTNARLRTFPRGLDAEVFSRAALVAAHKEAVKDYEREHVTPYIYEHPEKFRVVDFVAETDRSDLRLTLDTPEDLALLQRIFDSAPPGTARDLGIGRVLRLLDANPDWLAINAGVRQKTLEE
jgi:spore coat polysaccharide biosynthesis protein SpsF